MPPRFRFASRLPFVFAALFALAAPLAAAKEVPYLSGHVNDTAHLLSAAAQQRIEERLTQYEKETGHQIAVLTVESLDGDPVEDFSLRVAEAWKLGTKEKDDGVLFLVSKGDRKMRMEVGYGLEANLTDLQTHIIQEEVIQPRFRANDFDGGFEGGVEAIIKAINTPPSAAPAEAPKKDRGLPLGVLFFFFFFVFPFSWEAIRRRSWLLYVFFMPFYFFIGSLVHPGVGLAAVVLWAVAFPILRHFAPARLASKKGGGWWSSGGGGGWTSGGGGGWSSGGGGGGGFSGGGGSFGGGGSSSSW